MGDRGSNQFWYAYGVESLRCKPQHTDIALHDLFSIGVFVHASRIVKLEYHGDL